MKISCYGAAFNVEKFDFKIRDAVDNFCSFFDEVICTTVPSDDNTWQILKHLESEFKNFKVIYSDIQTTGNNKWDGQVRTEALKLCSNEIRVAVDYDERFPISNKSHWIRCASHLTENKNEVDGIFIPSLDLWGDENYIREDRPIRLKFRIHNSNVKRRGSVNFAKIDDNLFDIEKSDGTEPIDDNGNLCRFLHVLTNDYLKPKNASYLSNFAYSLHYGYVNLERKYDLAEKFWNKIWTDYQQVREIKLDHPDDLRKAKTIKHNLPLR